MLDDVEVKQQGCPIAHHLIEAVNALTAVIPGLKQSKPLLSSHCKSSWGERFLCIRPTQPALGYRGLLEFFNGMFIHGSPWLAG
jgi:hypothetical protein